MALGSFFKERKEKNMKKIKKIIIGLILGLILALTLAIAPQKVKAETTITDLTGYTWTANSIITIPTTPVTYNFNFTNFYGGNYYNYIGLELDNQVWWRYQEGENIYSKEVFGSVDSVKKWYSTEHRVINITGGEDSTNIELINWLYANGTFSLTTTDLTGFKWDAKSTINFKTLYGGDNYNYNFNINFSDSSAVNYIKINIYFRPSTDNKKINYYLNNTDNTKVYSSSSWDVESAKSIIINGGEDSTNGILIQFMYLNGTLTKTTSTMTAGDYRFNDVLLLGQSEFTGNISINFTSNNQNFTSMRLTADTLYYATENNEIEVYNVGVNWLVADSKYKKITINTAQEVSTDFYNWFSSNSTKEVYYTITFDRNGATSGDLPPLQDVLSGTTFDLNNYNPGNLGKTDSTFLGWNTDASATTPLSSIVVNSDVLLYAIFSENPKSVNIKITCRDNVVWQGNAIFSNNKIVGGVSWDNPTMTNVFFESLDSQNLTLINEKYGLNPNYTSNQLLLFFRPFSTEKDENGNYLAYINLIKLTTPNGTYASNYTSDTSPKNINFETWLASEGLTNMLKVDSDNYYFNLEISWSLEEPLPPGIAEWGNVATIMARIMASVTTLLNINIGFITIGNLLLIVIALSILFFVIKVWKGGN